MYHAFLVQSYVKTHFYTKLLYKNDVFNGKNTKLLVHSGYCE